MFMQFSKNVERASIDEAYIDLTQEVNVRLNEMKAEGRRIQADMLPCTHVIGWDGDGRSSEDDKQEEHEPGMTAGPLSTEGENFTIDKNTMHTKGKRQDEMSLATCVYSISSAKTIL